MNDKNTVINNSVSSAFTMVSALVSTLSGLNDNDEINDGIIKTAYIQITALNSQIVILQNELDNYRG